MKTEDWSSAFTNQGMPNIADKPLEARKKQGRIPNTGFRDEWPCQHLDFRLLRCNHLENCLIISFKAENTDICSNSTSRYSPFGNLPMFIQRHVLKCS